MPLEWAKYAIAIMHSVGTYPETSSLATCSGMFGHSRFSSLGHCGLILAYRVEVVSSSSSPL